MKKTVLAAALAMSLGAQAQTSTSSSTSVAAPATQTTTATVAETKPAAASPWSGALAFSVSQGIQAQKDKGSDAAIGSSNQWTVRYKATDKDTFAIGQDFTYNSIPIVAERDAKDPYQTDGLTMLDPFIRWNRSLGQVLWNEKTTLAIRAYVPVSRFSRANESYGRLRATMALPYILNSKVELEYLIDAWARMSAGSENFETRNNGTLRYNVSSTVSAYTTAGIWTRFKDVGAFNPSNDKFYGETGVETSAIKNVALSLYVDTSADNAGKGLYSAQNSSINFDTVVSF